MQLRFLLFFQTKYKICVTIMMMCQMRWFFIIFITFSASRKLLQIRISLFQSQVQQELSKQLLLSWMAKFFLGVGLIPVISWSELSNNLFIISAIHLTLENFLAKFCLYSRKCLFRASAASSESNPIGNNTLSMTVAPCTRILCIVGVIGCHGYKLI